MLSVTTATSFSNFVPITSQLINNTKTNSLSHIKLSLSYSICTCIQIQVQGAMEMAYKLYHKIVSAPKHRILNKYHNTKRTVIPQDCTYYTNRTVNINRTVHIVPQNCTYVILDCTYNTTGLYTIQQAT